MSFLEFNKLPLKVVYGTWKVEPIDAGDIFGRSLGSGIGEARSTRYRRFSCMIDALGLEWEDGAGVADAAEMDKLIRFLEGDGQSWRFDSASHSLSGNGVTNTASPGATLTKSATGGVFGGKLNIGAGGVFGTDMKNKCRSRGGWAPTQGWTIMARRNFVAGETASAGFHDCILTGAVEYSRGASSGNPAGVTQYIDGVAGSYNLGRVFSVSSVDPYVGLWGYKTDNTTVAIDYDDFVFLPYQLPAAWLGVVGVEGILEMRDNFQWPRMPRGVISGDAIRDANPVEVIARVRRQEAEQFLAAAGLDNNRELIELVMDEWGD
jgi:hypothetical protein